MTSSCQSKRRQSDCRYIWNQITLLFDESVPVLLLYNMASCSYSALFESVPRCGSSSNDAQDVQCVVISECNRDVFSHLKSLKIGPDEAICNEYTLLLARAGNISDLFHKTAICISWDDRSFICFINGFLPQAYFKLKTNIYP